MVISPPYPLSLSFAAMRGEDLERPIERNCGIPMLPK